MDRNYSDCLIFFFSPLIELVRAFITSACKASVLLKKQGMLFNVKFQAASADTLPSCIFTNIPVTLLFQPGLHERGYGLHHILCLLTDPGGEGKGEEEGRRGLDFVGA